MRSTESVCKRGTSIFLTNKVRGLGGGGAFGSGLLFLPCCLLVFLVTLPSKDQIFLSPHNLAICVQLTTTFSLLTSCQWEPIYSKNEKPWHTMRIPWKNHEKQLETMENHLQPCNMCATDNHNCLAYIRWMKSYIFIVQNFFLILTGTTLDYICKFMCAIDNHIFLPYILSMGNHIKNFQVIKGLSSEYKDCLDLPGVTPNSIYVDGSPNGLLTAKFHTYICYHQCFHNSVPHDCDKYYLLADPLLICPLRIFLTIRIGILFLQEHWCNMGYQIWKMLLLVTIFLLRRVCYMQKTFLSL